MALTNRLTILLDEYSKLYLATIRNESLLKALKTLSPEIKLEPRIAPSAPGMPPVIIEKTLKDRIIEIKRDYLLLSARLKVTVQIIEEEPDGKEELKKWKWSPLKEDG